MRPVYVLRWLDGLCYWVLLSRDGTRCVTQSDIGFSCDAEAKAHLNLLFVSS